MPPFTEYLLNASFKGVPFYVDSERQTEGGRRVVLHPFPNSDTQYIEDIGSIPWSFSIDAFVIGNNWLTDKDRLIYALEEEGEGLLYLPSYGSFMATALPYSSSVDQNELGMARFSLSFTLGIKQTSPLKVAQSTENDVYEKGDITREVLALSFSEEYQIPSTKKNIDTILDDLSSLLEEATSNTSILKNTGNVVKKADDILKNANTLIYSSVLFGKELFSPVSGLYQIISRELTNTISSVQNMIELCKFSSKLELYAYNIKTLFDIPKWNATTIERKQRNENRELFVNYSRLAFITSAYETAASVEYNTTSDIQTIRKLLEDTLKELNISDNIENISVKSSFLDLRIAALEVLDRKEQGAFKIIEIEKQNGLSSLLQSYELYAESLLTENDLINRSIELRKLNPLKSSIDMSGKINVFQI